MKIVRQKTNCFFVETDAGTKHCISYDQEVAAIDAKGKYTEFSGDRYFSKSSVTHKNMFKRHYGVGE